MRTFAPLAWNASPRAKRCFRELTTDLSLTALPVLVLLAMMPIPLSQSVVLAAMLGVQVLIGSSLFRLLKSATKISALVVATVGIVIGPAAVSFVVVLIGPAEFGVIRIWVVLAATALASIAALRPLEEAADVYRRTLTSSNVLRTSIAITGIACIAASNGFLWMLPVGASFIVIIVAAERHSASSIWTEAPLLWVGTSSAAILGRMLMSSPLGLTSPVDAVNASADGLQFEAWAHSLTQFGPFDDVYKAGSKVSYHWLSFAVAGVWHQLAGADPWVVSAIGVNILAVVASGLAAIAWIHDGNSQRRLCVSAGWALLVICSASLFESAVAMPFDSPSQALSIAPMVLCILVWRLASRGSATIRDRLQFGFLVVIAAAIVMLTKTSTLIPLLLVIVVDVLRVTREAGRNLREASRALLRVIWIPLTVAVALLVVYLVFFVDHQGFSWGRVSVKPRFWHLGSDAILGYLSLPFTSFVPVAGIGVVIWALRLGGGVRRLSGVTASGRRDLWVAAVLAHLILLVLWFDYARIAPYLVGSSSVLAALATVSASSDVRELDGLVGRAQVAVGLAGVFASGSSIALLAAQRLSQRAVLTLVAFAILAVALSAVVERVRRSNSDLRDSIGIACLLFSFGLFVGVSLRGPIREWTAYARGWGPPSALRASFDDALADALGVSTHLKHHSRVSDVVGTTRQPNELPLVSTLSGRRALAERHLPQGSKMKYRVIAQDEFGASGASQALWLLNDEYCVKWYVAFEPNVLPMYQAPAKVVYADKVATLIEFPDPPGGAECVPSDIKPRD